jgi:protein arginine kinase activator
MMICQECGQQPASLHFTKIVNGEKTEVHLCDSCAKEKGDALLNYGNFSIHQLLSGLMNFDPSPSTVMPGQGPVRCEHCGMTYQQFTKIGRFGCSECYRFFGNHLDPLFRRIHGSTRHIGKVPQRTGGHLKLKKQLAELKARLQQAVSREEFEEAAKLRDQIRMLEQRLNA